MKKNIKKFISLVLVLALSLTVCIPAFAKSTRSSNIISDQNATYDLSHLNGAAAYFQKHPQMISYSNDTIDKIIDDLSNYKETTENVQIKLQISNLIDDLQLDSSDNKQSANRIVTKASKSFNLQSKLDANTQAMYNTYNIAYAALFISTGANPIAAATGAYEATGIFFASKEREGGDWDYKRTIGWNTSCSTYINGRNISLRGEDIGNIHYGYVGSTYFPATVLKSAAGLVQIATGHPSSDFSSYFDDPNDQVQIQRGIDYFKTRKFK